MEVSKSSKKSFEAQQATHQLDPKTSPRPLPNSPSTSPTNNQARSNMEPKAKKPFSPK
jgi:hypothetical protein